MCIADGKLLFFHGISKYSVENKISVREYNNGAVYECFNNPFTDYFCIPALNLPPVTIDDRPCPHKRARYTPDLLPDTISVSSENFGSTLTTPSDYQKLFLLPSNDT